MFPLQCWYCCTIDNYAIEFTMERGVPSKSYSLSNLSLFRPLGKRRLSLPAINGKKLLKESSTGSLWSIYDDEISTSSTEDSSDCSSDPTNNGMSLEQDASYPWYMGNIPRLQAEQYLERMRNGTYLVRESDARMDYSHSIAVRYRNRTSHIRIFRRGGMYSISHSHSRTFSSIEELVSYYQEHSLSSCFPSVCTKLRFPYREELAVIEDELDSEDYADELPEVVEEEATASQVPHDCFLHVDTDVPLTNQQWYHGRLSRMEAEKILARQPHFSFLVRDSESVSTGYSLSVRDEASDGFVHLRISCPDGMYVLGQYSNPFRTVPECIAYYCQKKLTIKGATHSCLRYPVSRMRRI